MGASGGFGGHELHLGRTSHLCVCLCVMMVTCAVRDDGNLMLLMYRCP